MNYAFVVVAAKSNNEMSHWVFLLIHLIHTNISPLFSAQEKEKLLLMSGTSEAGKAEYQKWVVQDVRNIVHIFEDLPSCKPPLDYLCELLPRLQARYYSISSSSKVIDVDFYFW